MQTGRQHSPHSGLPLWLGLENTSINGPHMGAVSIQTSDSSVSLSRDSHCPPSSISHQDLPKPQEYSLANLSKSWGSLLVCPEVLRTYILGGRYKGQGGSATPYWQRAFLSSPHPAAPRSPSLCGLRLSPINLCAWETVSSSTYLITFLSAA